jgi:hypothetical protein
LRSTSAWIFTCGIFRTDIEENLRKRRLLRNAHSSSSRCQLGFEAAAAYPVLLCRLMDERRRLR